jgi:hypothetical protein
MQKQYTRGTFTLCNMVLSADNNQEGIQAIDLLSASDAFTLSLRRKLRYHLFEIGNANRAIEEISQPLATAPFHLQHGRGLALLQLPSDLQPSCDIPGYLSVSYELVISVHDVTGYHVLPVDGEGSEKCSERDVFTRVVEITTNQVERPPDYCI